jgi:Skp family chaperone for outer membrane proteins
MKHLLPVLLLALTLTACSDSQQREIDEINTSTAEKATDHLQKPLEQAKDLQKITADRYTDLEKKQE